MKKKTVKKLALSKETVRGLTVDLKRAAGAYPTQTLESCGCHSYAYICDAQETVQSPCTA